MLERFNLTYLAEKFGQNSGIYWFLAKFYRIRKALIMFFADLLGFGAASSLLYVVNLWLKLFIFEWHDFSYIVIVLFCLGLFIPSKLYQGIGLNPVEEIRLVSLNTTIGFLLGIFFFGFNPTHQHLNYLAMFPFGVFSMVFVLGARWGLRIISVQLGIWGSPVVVIGAGAHANQLARYFLNRKRLGFLPRYVVTELEDVKDLPSPVAALNWEHLLNCPQDYFSSRNIYTALIDITDAPEIFYSPRFARLSQLFPHLIFVSNLSGMLNSSFQIHDFEGLMGLEVNKNVLSPFDVFIKRMMDITLSSLLIVFSFPIWALSILLIRLDSPGPIFFTQLRVGRIRHNSHDQEELMDQHHKIKIYKFRTMVVNAEQVLEEYLETHPQARAEWKHSQKLKADPRITRVGDWLRKFSIDELPQILNVLKGEMSLVGPRPIMVDQISDYGDKMNVYNTVRPGLTGLWQVSGRNNTSFTERAAFDEYYIHNWSAWLDIYILLRTVWVVLSRDGAY